MTDEQHVIAECRVCRQPTKHVTIERVVRWQQPILCTICGTVQSVQKTLAEAPRG